MNESIIQAAIAQTVALMHYYGFDLRGYTTVEQIAIWLDKYSAIWIRLATVEALYQGRYKTISVEQILLFWRRRGRPTHHFNHEFESLICRELPLNLSDRREQNQLTLLLDAIAPSPKPSPPPPPETEPQQESETGIPQPVHRPIHKFTPPPDDSGFYDKLKQVQDNLETDEDLELEHSS
ncbi:MAG: hypothetical protein SAJ12_12170 [Jaaginema sp. PMC 1079.18]|nr:hypothetical protein [Jaaginema sp. PMC 1080.18]MEC4851761.1 hypothetical protein [Jaaginema sp. PMC 1079.18]MEC4867240.1 hypothetical protein [Jaaginema sp. PMC 1078.18]